VQKNSLQGCIIIDVTTANKDFMKKVGGAGGEIKDEDLGWGCGDYLPFFWKTRAILQICEVKYVLPFKCNVRAKADQGSIYI